MIDVSNLYVYNSPLKNYWGYSIEKVEAFYAAKSGGEVKYMGDFCRFIDNERGGYYLEQPSAIFWQEKPPHGYSPYFGLFKKYDDPLDLSGEAYTYISEGASAFHKPLVGIVANNGEVVISRYRHDMRFSQDGSVWIDGGRDYVRHGGSPNGFANVTVNGSQFNIERTP